PLAYIVRDQINEQAFDAPQKFPRLRKRTDVARHARIAPRILAQLRNKVRIRQKAHVKHKVGVRWYSIAVSEADQRNHHRPPVRFLEAPDDKLPQFMNVEFGGVDHHVGELAYR